MADQKKLLFVCLGNICRSPTAEAVAKEKIKQQNLGWICDSAGTAGYHIGEASDPRSIAHGKTRGYDLNTLARQVQLSDFKEFDYILAMDESNFRNLEKIQPSDATAELLLITDYCKKFDLPGVPDPYYGKEKDFDLVIDILEDAVDEMIVSLKA